MLDSGCPDCDVAKELGVNHEMLRNWVTKAKQDRAGTGRWRAAGVKQATARRAETPTSQSCVSSTGGRAGGPLRDRSQALKHGWQPVLAPTATGARLLITSLDRVLQPKSVVPRGYRLVVIQSGRSAHGR
ncbi:hypothetical protein [Micromonospora wenchangensis]|uniref:hypothetical protein n=1 Tax=Micromonospora wenchangensis TaxID=1185415 RepID=UPI003802EDC1